MVVFSPASIAHPSRNGKGRRRFMMQPSAPFCTLIMALTENSKGIAPPAGLPSYSMISASPGTLWRGAGLEI
jgi:hypothetical protein